MISREENDPRTPRISKTTATAEMCSDSVQLLINLLSVTRAVAGTFQQGYVRFAMALHRRRCRPGMRMAG